MTVLISEKIFADTAFYFLFLNQNLIFDYFLNNIWNRLSSVQYLRVKPFRLAELFAGGE